MGRDTQADRVAMMQLFYDVAQRCLQLRNLHLALAIFCGISLKQVNRLKRLRRRVREKVKYRKLEEKFEEYLASTRNHYKYRRLVENWFAPEARFPCIPFMLFVFKDLFNLQEKLVEKKGRHGQECLNLVKLAQNCRLIKRVTDLQRRSRNYANQLKENVALQIR